MASIAILFDSFNAVLVAIGTRITFLKPLSDALRMINMIAWQFCITLWLETYAADSLL